MSDVEQVEQAAAPKPKTRRAKLTKKTVDAAQPKRERYAIWDTQLIGFHCRVFPNGRKAYYARYRTPSGKTRCPKLGDHGAITPAQARELARQALAGAKRGHDLSGERQQVRREPTINELAATRAN